jgi:hypothetical protein
MALWKGDYLRLASFLSWDQRKSIKKQIDDFSTILSIASRRADLWEEIVNFYHWKVSPQVTSENGEVATQIDIF